MYKFFFILFIFYTQCLCAQNKGTRYSKHTLDSTLNVYRQKYTENSHEFADCVEWCAMACLQEGDNVQSAKLLKISNNIFRKYGRGTFNGRDTINEILRLDILSMLEQNSERDYFAIQYSKRSLRLKKIFFGPKSEQTLNALLDLSKLYAGRLKYKKSAKLHNEAYVNYVELLKREFCSSSESKRNSYWITASRYVGKTLTEAQKYAGKRFASQSSMASAAYNANLLSKGILLNTTIDFENFVNASNVSEAIRLLEEKKHLSDVSLQDSLDYAILRELNNAGQEYNIPMLSVTWKDVAEKLGDSDVAIEFYRTALKEYGALIIKKGWRSPKIVKLKDQIRIGAKYHQIEDVLRQTTDDLRSQESEDPDLMWALSKAIWTDMLQKYLPKDKKAKVYFSADGMLQLLGVESLPFYKPMDKCYVRMSDIYSLYRLSSTRILALNNNEIKHEENATLYGDIRYDIDAVTMQTESKKYPVTNNSSRGLRPALNDSITPLFQTRVEVENIESILNKNTTYKVKKLVQAEANEESFKFLSGKKQKILHIATHGFYSPEDKASNIAEDDIEVDRSMQRTGLFLAGAQNFFKYEDLPDGVEDGVLTAFEISKIDLSFLDIAVLSACETALGDITKDGVAGLQRGFKQAGTNSILMSLWKVDDAATCKLMTEFYFNWISKNMTKHDALEAAKKTVRETKGWEDSKYWAAFILLDGLD